MVLSNDEMCVELGNNNKEPLGNDTFISKKISDGIGALKATAHWPRDEKTPAFNDEAAKVYLNIVPKKMHNESIPPSLLYITLPNPLSLNRRVCYITGKELSEELQTEYSQNLQKLGFLGKIKIIPATLIESAYESNDQAASDRLTQHYDTYLVDIHAIRRSKLYMDRLKLLLSKEKKTLQQTLSKRIIHPLSTTSFWVNTEQNGYVVTVGHTGLTDKQLQENIDCALNKAWEIKFLKDLNDVQLLQIKTGTSEAITIHRDDTVNEVAAVVEVEQESDLPPEVITEAIAKLKTVADWSKEAKPPAFNDESANVYLHVLLKKLMTKKKNRGLRMEFPHPLSLDRSVCCIGSNLENEDQQVKTTQMLRKQGVLGKIKMVPKSLFDAAIANKDQDAIEELVKLYDTYLVEWNLKLPDKINFLCRQKDKAFIVAGTSFSCGLNYPVILINKSMDGFKIKVGHTGLTDKQLQENISSVVNFISKDAKIMFRSKLSEMNLMQIKTGTSEGVTIYQDAAFVQLLDGVRKLRALAGWTETDANPAFNDPGATVYLEVAHLNLQNRFRPGHWGIASLRHSLSMNRRVCFILQSEEDLKVVEAALPNSPITGKVKVMPAKLVIKALDDNDTEALSTLAKRYDTILHNLNMDSAKRLNRFMEREQKLAMRLHDLQDGLWNNLNDTVFWSNNTNDKIFAPVGHSGLTDKQLAENVKTVFLSNLKFPKNPHLLSDITLRTGTSQPVSIFNPPPRTVQVAPERLKNQAGMKRPNDDPRAASVPEKRQMVI